MINLSDGAKFAIQRLKNRGFEAYAVGGCVRDALSGVTPYDFDVTTSATPTQTLDTFSDCKTFPTGLVHGTITLVYRGENVEITTFRLDGKYSDGRRPDRVTFSSDVVADLARRDFTVNAMAYDGKKLVDPFGGRLDLKKRVIRCVGDPTVRFNEDALRILRLLRFCSTLNFNSDEKTADAAVALSGNLERVSAERIASELCKTLLGKNAAAVLRRFKSVILRVLPELSVLDVDEYERIALTVEKVQGDLATKWSVLLSNIETHLADPTQNPSSGEIAMKILTRLKLPNKLKDDVRRLVDNRSIEIHPTEKSVKMALSILDDDTFYDILRIRAAEAIVLSDETKKRNIELVKNIADSVIIRGDCLRLKDLAIDGKDLLSLGLEGKHIGKTLNDILSLVINGDIENDKATILNKLKTQL